MRNVLSATMVFLALCFSTGVAVAQQPTQAQRDEIRNSCRSDFMSNCSSVTPGGAEALRCLQQNSARLSGACRNAVNAIGPPPAQPASTPAAPTAAAPTTAPATAHPTPAARTAKAPAMQAVAPRQVTPGRRAAIRTACQTDFIARCPGVQPGGTQALQCLQGHAPELASACRSGVGRHRAVSGRSYRASGCGRARGRYRADPAPAAARPTRDSQHLQGRADIALRWRPRRRRAARRLPRG